MLSYSAVMRPFTWSLVDGELAPTPTRLFVVSKFRIESMSVHPVILPDIEMSPTLLMFPLMLVGTPPEVQYVCPQAVLLVVVNFAADLATPLELK